MSLDRELAKVRLLIIGKRGGILQWPEHLISAAEILGIDFKFFAVNHQNGVDRVIKRAKAMVSSSLVAEHSASQLDVVFDNFRPNFVLLVDLVNATEQMGQVLERYKHTYRSAQWIGDFFPENLTRHNSFIDRFYFTDSCLVEQAKAAGFNEPLYLPLAVDKKLFSDSAKPWLERKDKIVFVGAYSKNRFNVLQAFNQPLIIYGKGWSKQQLPLHEVHSHNISLGKVAELYGCHKYVLNIINVDNIACGVNMRCFEATAAGALLITDNVKDLYQCFEVDKHLKLWSFNYDGCVECDDLTSGIADIAMRGMSHTDAHHTYDKRLTSILVEFGA